jgi:hypothetical protein
MVYAQECRHVLQSANERVNTRVDQLGFEFSDRISLSQVQLFYAERVFSEWPGKE